MGPGMGPPRNQTECPQCAGLRADRMSGVARWVSLEQALCQAGVDRMSLAEWHVHLPGSACLTAACTVGFAVVGSLESHFANLFLCFSRLWGSGAGNESKGCSLAVGWSGAGRVSLSNPNQMLEHHLNFQNPNLRIES